MALYPSIRFQALSQSTSILIMSDPSSQGLILFNLTYDKFFLEIAVVPLNKVICCLIFSGKYKLSNLRFFITYNESHTKVEA